MTTPSLTPDGGTPCQPRDWLESLCERQPDGTWLVQAPRMGSQAPRLYLLPDERTKEAYVAQATRVIGADVAVYRWWPPLFMTVMFGQLFSKWWSMFMIHDDTFASMSGSAMIIFFLALLVLLHVPRRRQSRLAAWLGKVRVKPTVGATPSQMTVRTEQEWQAFLLSMEQRGERALTQGMIWVTLVLVAASIAAYLNVCQGVSSLDPFIIEQARQREMAWSRCGSDGKYLLFSIGLALFVIVFFLLILPRRRRRLARAVAVDRSA